MSVKVRYRKVSNNRYNIYLDRYYNSNSRSAETLEGYVVTKDYSKQKRKRFTNKQDQEYVLLAEAKAAEENKKILTGIPPLKKDFELFSFLDKVIEESKGSEIPAFNKLKANLKKFQITPIKLSHITKEWFEDFKTFLEVKHKPSTTDTYLGRMKILLDKACEKGCIDRNPFPGKGFYINQKAYKKDVNDYLTFDELKELNNLQFDSDVCRAFLFGCFSGLRLSDIERLRWDNIIDDEIHIVQFKTRKKFPKANTIPLADEAKRILNSIEKKSEKVFNLPSRNEIGLTLETWRNVVGIKKKMNFHKSRHTFAAICLERGISPYELKEMMGHSSLETTIQFYGHLTKQKLKDQIKSLPTFNL